MFVVGDDVVEWYVEYALVESFVYDNFKFGGSFVFVGVAFDVGVDVDDVLCDDVA